MSGPLGEQIKGLGSSYTDGGGPKIVERQSDVVVEDAARAAGIKSGDTKSVTINGTTKIETAPKKPGSGPEASSCGDLIL